MGRLSVSTCRRGRRAVLSAPAAGALAALLFGPALGPVGCATTDTSRRNSNPLNLPDHFRSRDALSAHASVTILLGMWHAAAARGDFDAYFSRMTDDAVFLGTDPDERWTRAEFEAFAGPYFDGVEAWTYEAIDRHVVVGSSDDSSVVWFDEVLWNDKYGRCRGTGVARLGSDGDWRIAHYSLAFLVPNDKASAVMDAIGTQSTPDVD